MSNEKLTGVLEGGKGQNEEEFCLSVDDRNINPQVNHIDRSSCVLYVVQEKHLTCMEPEVRLESCSSDMKGT